MRANPTVAVEPPYSVEFEDGVFMRDRLIAIRDTLVVLGLQIVFRLTMFLRHLNY